MPSSLSSSLLLGSGMRLRMMVVMVDVGFFQIGQASAQYGGSGAAGGYGGSSSGGSEAGSGVPAAGGYDWTSSPSFLKQNRITIIHATLASLAWVILFPLGSIFLRVIQSKAAWKIHGVIQIFGLLVFVAAVGLGIWLAQKVQKYTAVWTDPHIVIGLLVFALAAIQPILGWVHHILFRRKGDGQRTGFGVVHVWLGRILIILGIINGGLGLRLAGQSPLQAHAATKKAEIAYGVVSGVMFLLYFFVSVLWEIRRGRKEGGGERMTRRTNGSGQMANNVETRSEKRITADSSPSDERLMEGEFQVYRTNSGPLVQKI